MCISLTRRSLFAGALAATPFAQYLESMTPDVAKSNRSDTACSLRQQAAVMQRKRATSSMIANGDEDVLPYRIACFTKGMPQNEYGEVKPTAYSALLNAIKTGKHLDFESIPRGGGRKLSNPQSAYTYQFEGGDAHTFDIPMAPSLGMPIAAWESAELYCQAFCRDVAFSDYETSPEIHLAAKYLGRTPSSIFRGSRKADLTGPYLSQFLLKPIPYGSGKVEQRYYVPVAGSDFLTTINEWKQIQAGIPPWREAMYDSKPRHIRNGRDLAEWVHYDFPYQAYLNAALILINSGPKSVLNCNQFKSASNPYKYSTVQEGFVTFGIVETTEWLGRVSSAALKAAYCQKWMVHRRLRPEALGGLIHQTRTGVRTYPLGPLLLNSEAVEAVHSRTGSYLLPQAYPEGCPLHPSYPSGHAAIAGACSVVLKACFDSAILFPGCVELSVDGVSLKPCTNYAPTVGDEIDKLAFNVAMGRDWAGIHYRSDNAAGLRLGEDVGITILQDLARIYTEDFKGFSFPRFDGTQIDITPQGEVFET